MFKYFQIYFYPLRNLTKNKEEIPKFGCNWTCYTFAIVKKQMLEILLGIVKSAFHLEMSWSEGVLTHKVFDWYCGSHQQRTNLKHTIYSLLCDWTVVAEWESVLAFRKVERGTPQSGVFFPLLWILVVNDVWKELEEWGFQVIAYVDHGALMLLSLRWELYSLISEVKKESRRWSLLSLALHHHTTGASFKLLPYYTCIIDRESTLTTILYD